ncbi:MAG TPA: MBL fold metallo-hydrolase [Bryobacteraceae bacterium]|nr:MBL fold metallo-hydrolase [Bryobacteraceae bacterium]
MRLLLPGILLVALPALSPAAKNLEVYSIDVEGGQATLMVSPTGESLLVDTGWAGYNRRDADRILAAAKSAGVKKIDYLVITHYHADHVGGVPQLAEKIPIRNFVDHGPSVETGKDAEVLFNAYSAFRDKGTHLLVKPGDTIPIKGLDVKVLSSAGDVIGAPLAGAGQPNPECASFEKHEVDSTENAQSVGILVSYGDFRMIDLGDLTWNKEFDLVCPSNKIGPVDVYIVSHHGMNMSGSPQLVHALHPRLALMNNGARKGGAPEIWQTIHDSPGLQDIWQLHFAVAGGKEHNSSDTVIANIDEICEGKWLRLTAEKDGTITMYNSRNKYERTYKK